ncbi:hypothetical protein Ea92_33A [Erwinia phage Ea9-2]|uniref:Uncharacterized protein n=1 Tax=Erwinia phage Ea9-2 TaxID=1429767 RepID=W6ARH1_9CAUD|nr:hypothetical protein Ea92_33A [Erwinia phage Ea9-2]AHI60091.1 hypothetical protein Ea92_33A [Erwinia phage Ea9-2]
MNAAFVIGGIFGIILMGCLSHWVGPFNTAELQAAREQCEKTLPRDQHCVYYFTPEKKP